MHSTMGRPPIYAKRLLVAVDAAFLERVDTWRAQQPGLPNRSEAIRRIVMAATTPTKPKSKGKPRR